MSRDEYQKYPTELKDYVVNWNKQMTIDGNDTILTSAWAVEPTGTLTINTPPATNSTTTATVWCSSGQAGQRYIVSNTITTSGGRTHKTSIVISVTDKVQQVM